MPGGWRIPIVAVGPERAAGTWFDVCVAIAPRRWTIYADDEAVDHPMFVRISNYLDAEGWDTVADVELWLQFQLPDDLAVGHLKEWDDMSKSKTTSKEETTTFTRRALPNERAGITHKFKIGAGEDEVKGYLTTGHYDDGTLGEIFIKMDKQGSQVSGFCDAWAISVSMLLQGGMLMRDIARKFKGMSFEPAGLTGNKDIPFARSPIDYVARWLERKYP